MSADPQAATTLTLPPTDAPGASRNALPTMYDLPSEDPEEPGLPDVFHDIQPQLLRETFRPPSYSLDEIFSASDMNLYYDLSHPLWHKRPDWFAVLGVPRLYDGHDLRLSYVVWQERVAPYLVVELLSPGTELEDLGVTVSAAQAPPSKWTVYETVLRIPYYVVFSRYTNEARYFVLHNERYREVRPSGQGLWLPEASLGLGLWSGSYDNTERQWLRFYDAQHRWIPTVAEQSQQQAETERQRAETERQRAETERQRAEAEHQRAETERQRAEAERQRAETERQRAEAAEAELAQLRARLARLEGA
ncbi:MAG: Uma2 family endonuclease [Candidatus Tectimicrobiota bacterium]